MRALAVRTRSRQHYPAASISPEFLVNGASPDTSEYRRLAADGFTAWRLEVSELVETPLSLKLADLHQMPAQTQITKHHCIQGWSGIAEWGLKTRTILRIQEVVAEAQVRADALMAEHQDALITVATAVYEARRLTDDRLNAVLVSAGFTLPRPTA